MFDDVADLVQAAADSETYRSARAAAERAVRVVKGAAEGGVARGYSPIAWGFRGVDLVVDKTGLDPGGEMRARVGWTPEQLEADPFGVRVLPPEGEDEPGIARAGAIGGDPGAPAADVAQSGVFDP